MSENLCACYCHCKQQMKTNMTGGETIEEKKQFSFFFPVSGTGNPAFSLVSWAL